MSFGYVAFLCFLLWRKKAGIEKNHFNSFQIFANIFKCENKKESRVRQLSPEPSRDSLEATLFSVISESCSRFCFRKLGTNSPPATIFNWTTKQQTRPERFDTSELPKLFAFVKTAFFGRKKFELRPPRSQWGWYDNLCTKVWFQKAGGGGGGGEGGGRVSNVWLISGPHPFSSVWLVAVLPASVAASAPSSLANSYIYFLCFFSCVG
jgi:hypothetical protein